MNSPMPVQAEAWTSKSVVSSYTLAAPAVRAAGMAERPIRLNVPANAPVSLQGPLLPRQEIPVTGNIKAIRAFDFVGAMAALVLLAPLMLVTAIAILLFDPGPLLFAHMRLGQGGRSFRCLKFRTMAVDADAQLAHLLETDEDARTEWQHTQKLRRDPRITPIGRFLRRSCLDELPQFFNVLLGDMSLVGPRPIVAGEAARYGRHFSVYCSLKPGITGLWQVKRQDQTSYRRRVAFDLAYARSRSLALNVRILLLTVPCVLQGKGAC